jgi:hypothetical protein
MVEIGHNEMFREQTKKLNIDIITELSKIKYTNESLIIKKRIRSNKDRYAKIFIMFEGIEETVFWFKLIKDLNILLKEKIHEFKKETDNTLKATSSFKRTFKFIKMQFKFSHYHFLSLTIQK